MINNDDYFVAKIGCSLSYDVIIQIKNILNEHQFALFKFTYFGYFLKLPKFEVQCQLIHSLLLRELKQPNSFYCWFDVCGNRLKFGIEKFALASSLNCLFDTRNMSVFPEKNNLLEKYFGSLKKINK